MLQLSNIDRRRRRCNSARVARPETINPVVIISIISFRFSRSVFCDSGPFARARSLGGLSHNICNESISQPQLSSPGKLSVMMIGREGCVRSVPGCHHTLFGQVGSRCTELPRRLTFLLSRIGIRLRGANPPQELLAPFRLGDDRQ